MTTPVGVLLEALAGETDQEAAVAEARRLLQEYGTSTVMRHYERLARRQYGSEELAKLTRVLAFALGFREYVEGRPTLRLLVAQPVVLDLTDLRKETPAALPTTAMRKVLYGLYGLPESTPLRFGPTLVSPNDATIYDARAVAKLLEEAPEVPFTVPGYHFRFFPVYLEVYTLQGELNLANPRPLQSLLKVHYNARNVYLLPPVECFNLWVLYDRLNKGG